MLLAIEPYIMKSNNSWYSDGTEIFVERIGRCSLYRRLINGEFYQFKIKYGFTTVIGEPSYDNVTALNNALIELKKKFKSILSNR